MWVRKSHKVSILPDISIVPLYWQPIYPRVLEWNLEKACISMSVRIFALACWFFSDEIHHFKPTPNSHHIKIGCHISIPYLVRRYIEVGGRLNLKDDIDDKHNRLRMAAIGHSSIMGASMLCQVLCGNVLLWNLSSRNGNNWETVQRPVNIALTYSHIRLLSLLSNHPSYLKLYKTVSFQSTQTSAHVPDSNQYCNGCCLPSNSYQKSTCVYDHSRPWISASRGGLLVVCNTGYCWKQLLSRIRSSNFPQRLLPSSLCLSGWPSMLMEN